VSQKKVPFFSFAKKDSIFLPEFGVFVLFLFIEAGLSLANIITKSYFISRNNLANISNKL